MDIKEALSNLDVLDDENWTQDGSPKVEKISELVGHTVTRAEIIDAAPKFTKENPVIDDLHPEEEKVASPVVDDVLYLLAEPMEPAALAAKVLQVIPK